MKICSKCLIEKDLSCFGRRGKGLQGKCKDCKRIYDNNYHKNRDFISKSKKYTLQKSRIKELYLKINEIKILKGCIDCGYNINPSALQFDHQYGKYKNVSNLVGQGYSIDNILNEINKCEIRCANCHSIKTSKDFNRHN